MKIMHGKVYVQSNYREYCSGMVDSDEDDMLNYNEFVELFTQKLII